MWRVYSAASGSGAITQLSSVIWLSNVLTGDWANAANWAGGALPDGSNVANVTLPTGVSVSFSGTTAATTLTSLSGNGANLTLLSGSLTTGNATLASYNQSGGSFDAAGNVNIETNFNRSGGSFGVHGLLTINQSSGDLRLSTNSALSLGQIRVLNGNLVIDNNGAVTSSSSAPVIASGSIGIEAHSPITVGAGGMTAGNGIALSATTASADSTITTAGKLTGGTGLVSLTAYQSITQNADISGANIELTSQHGNIAIASGAFSTVPTGGNIRLLASLGDVLSNASNFVGATPQIRDRRFTEASDSNLSTTIASVTSTIANLADDRAAVGSVVEAPLLAAIGPSASALLASNRTTGGEAGTFGASESNATSTSADEDEKKTGETKAKGNDGADVAKKVVAQCS